MPHRARNFYFSLDKVSEDIYVLIRPCGELTHMHVSRYHADSVIKTNPSHQTGAIVSIDRALPRETCTTYITLPSKKYGMYQWLGLVQVVQQKNGCRDKTEQNGQVVCYKTVRESRRHDPVWFARAPSERLLPALMANVSSAH